MAGERLQALQDALLQAFPGEDALRELLFRMDLKLSVVTMARALPAMMLDVIEYFEARGRLDALIGRACELRSQNRGLLEVVQVQWPEVYTSLPTLPSLPALVRPPDVAPLPARRRETALSQNEWQHLIRFIREKKCTPVIGPGVCRSVLPGNVELAMEWADRWQYPFADRADLARVSQFLALTEYRLMPHEQVQQRYSSARTPDFDHPDEPHGLLADLGLPLYLTTNYDDIMMKALTSRRMKPTRTFPAWNQNLREQAAFDANPPEAASGPLVYHLFGHHDVPESMVLTEDDHLGFLSCVSADPRLFPPIVKRALSSTSLLFIGFGVLDWGFRVLVRSMLQSVTAPNMRPGVAVQLPPENLSEAQRAQVERYLESFLNDSGNLRFRVYWGDTYEFTATLRALWEEQRHAVAS